MTTKDAKLLNQAITAVPHAPSELAPQSFTTADMYQVVEAEGENLVIWDTRCRLNRKVEQGKELTNHLLLGHGCAHASKWTDGVLRCVDV